MRVIQSERKRPLNLLAFGARGHIAAASSEFGVQGDVEVWDAASGKLIIARTISEHFVTGLAFTPSGEHLLAGSDTTLHVLQVPTGENLPGPNLTMGFPKFAISTTRDRLLAVERVNQHPRVACWEFEDGREFRQLWTHEPHEYLGFDAPAISHDGVSVAHSWLWPFGRSSTSPKESIYVRDSADGTPRTTMNGDPSNPIVEIQFTVDGLLLLTRPLGRIVSIFDATTGKPRGELIHPGRSFISGMAVHPSGLLACSRNNGTVCLWNVEKRELIRILDWKLGKLMSVAFSPDGSLGAAGTEDGQVIVWDMDE